MNLQAARLQIDSNTECPLPHIVPLSALVCDLSLLSGVYCRCCRNFAIFPPSAFPLLSWPPYRENKGQHLALWGGGEGGRGEYSRTVGTVLCYSNVLNKSSYSQLYCSYRYTGSVLCKDILVQSLTNCYSFSL